MTRRIRPLLELRGATFRLGESLIFRNTDWAFCRGEHWAIVGPNGSGKSNFAKGLCGRLPVVEGEVRYSFGTRGIADEVFPEEAIRKVSVDDHRRLVASIVQYHQARWSPIDDPPYPTARDVILEDCSDDHPRHLLRIARWLGIEHLLDRKLPHLSNGEMRKTLIARAMVPSPRLLILDDPLAGLDADSRVHLRGILDGLMGGGLPVLLLTQRPDELLRRITHIAVVDHQRILSTGPRRIMIRHRSLTERAASRLTLHVSKRVASDRRAHASTARARKRLSRSQAAVSAEPVVQFHGARVIYDGACIIHPIEWTVCRGQRWALLGRNGSGKTTVLSLVLGDNPQCYSNPVEVFGHPWGFGTNLWEVRRRIGYASPELQYHYPGDMSCAAVVCSGFFDSVGLYQSCSTRHRRIAANWMRRLGLAAMAATDFGALSDGQQRMALLARAMVKDPPLLILDEPCQGLDAAHRGAIRSAVDRFAATPGRTLIYVTHHPDEMPSCITHELRLSGGRVVRCGPRRSAGR